jgi:hypothetical protein
MPSERCAVQNFGICKDDILSYLWSVKFIPIFVITYMPHSLVIMIGDWNLSGLTETNQTRKLKGTVW